MRMHDYFILFFTLAIFELFDLLPALLLLIYTYLIIVRDGHKVCMSTGPILSGKARPCFNTSLGFFSRLEELLLGT